MSVLKEGRVVGVRRSKCSSSSTLIVFPSEQVISIIIIVLVIVIVIIIVLVVIIIVIPSQPVIRINLPPLTLDLTLTSLTLT